MIAMAVDNHMPKWRNFASWSAVGGALVIVAVSLASGLRHGDPLDGFFRSGALDLRIAVAVLFSAAVVGLSSQNIAFGWRSFRNFMIVSAAAIAIAALAVGGFMTLVSAGAFGTLGASRWAAAGVGLALLFFAAFIGLVQTAAGRGLNLLEAEQVEIFRERGRLLLLSWIAIAAMGLMLIVLSLAGQGSVLSPAAALAGLLALAAVAIAVSVAAWRGMDELDRALSYESCNIAFYLIVLLGGGWATLAHLDLAPAAAPLDWLTMFTVIVFAASFVAVGRRKLLTQ